MNAVELAFGLRMRDARNAAGFTQESLALKIGMKQPSLAKKEAGKVPVRISELVDISVALGVSVEWLCTGDQSPFTPDYIRGRRDGIRHLRRKVMSALGESNE